MLTGLKKHERVLVPEALGFQLSDRDPCVDARALRSRVRSSGKRTNRRVRRGLAGPRTGGSTWDT
jgi:hypothetical protein